MAIPFTSDTTATANTSGFYRLLGSVLQFAPTAVHAPGYTLQRSDRARIALPMDGWDWFDSREAACAHHNLPLPAPAAGHPGQSTGQPMGQATGHSDQPGAIAAARERSSGCCRWTCSAGWSSASAADPSRPLSWSWPGCRLIPYCERADVTVQVQIGLRITTLRVALLGCPVPPRQLLQQRDGGGAPATSMQPLIPTGGIGGEPFDPERWAPTRRPSWSQPSAVSW